MVKVPFNERLVLKVSGNDRFIKSRFKQFCIREKNNSPFLNSKTIKKLQINFPIMLHWDFIKVT